MGARSNELRDVLARTKRVAVLTGAGISAESGIATFRSPGGIWTKFKPEELANIDAFMRNPELVWEWYEHRRSVVREAKPNAGHLALAEMEQLFDNVEIATQNVDGLHQRAGSSAVYELHGSLLSHRCLECGEPYELAEEEAGVPNCHDCGGIIRPGVVWFGEELPYEAWMRSEEAAATADLFLTVGTSAVVFPAAGLAYTAKASGAFVIEVNPEETEFTSNADLSLRGKAGEELPKLLEMMREVKDHPRLDSLRSPKRPLFP